MVMPDERSLKLDRLDRLPVWLSDNLGPPVLKSERKLLLGIRPLDESLGLREDLSVLPNGSAPAGKTAETPKQGETGDRSDLPQCPKRLTITTRLPRVAGRAGGNGEPVPAIRRKRERRSRNVRNPKRGLGPGRLGAKFHLYRLPSWTSTAQVRRILSTISPKSPPGKCATARSRGARGRAAPTKNRSEAASRSGPSPLESPIAAVRRQEIPSSAASSRSQVPLSRAQTC